MTDIKHELARGRRCVIWYYSHVTTTNALAMRRDRQHVDLEILQDQFWQPHESIQSHTLHSTERKPPLYAKMLIPSEYQVSINCA